MHTTFRGVTEHYGPFFIFLTTERATLPALKRALVLKDCGYGGPGFILGGEGTLGIVAQMVNRSAGET